MPFWSDAHNGCVNEMKLATWRFPITTWLPPDADAATMLDIDLASHPDLVNHLADWDPVSHTISTTDDGHVVMTVRLWRRVTAPDTPRTSDIPKRR